MRKKYIFSLMNIYLVVGGCVNGTHPPIVSISSIETIPISRPDDTIKKTHDVNIKTAEYIHIKGADVIDKSVLTPTPRAIKYDNINAKPEVDIPITPQLNIREDLVETINIPSTSVIPIKEYRRDTYLPQPADTVQLRDTPASENTASILSLYNIENDIVHIKEPQTNDSSLPRGGGNIISIKEASTGYVLEDAEYYKFLKIYYSDVFDNEMIILNNDDDALLISQWAERVQNVNSNFNKKRQFKKLGFDAKDIRIVGQLVTPADQTEEDNQEEELMYFKSLGFNSILVVWKGENNINRLLELTERYKNEGWIIFFTYGPEELNDTNIFIDINIYSDKMRQFMPFCDAIIPTWRKASAPHLNINGKEYFKVLVNEIYNISRKVPVLGETYVEVGSDIHFTGNSHQRLSGSVILNATDYRYHIGYLAKYFINENIKTPFIFTLMGPTPYWEWYGNITTAEIAMAYNIKKMKELNEDGHGVLVLVGGGGGTRTLKGIPVSDDLTKSKYHITGIQGE